MEDPEASGGREAIPEENAAVLEILEKNGAFDEVADNSDEETREVRAREAEGVDETREVRAGGAREAEEIADNFTEGDEFPEERAGGARETEERAGGARETRKIFRRSAGSRRNC